MQDKIKSAPLPLDPTKHLMLQNISDTFVYFKKHFEKVAEKLKWRKEH